MIEREGRYGPFFACMHYRECGQKPIPIKKTNKSKRVNQNIDAQNMGVNLFKRAATLSARLKSGVPTLREMDDDSDNPF